jgi:hypothetical protein
MVSSTVTVVRSSPGWRQPTAVDCLYPAHRHTGPGEFPLGGDNGEGESRAVLSELCDTLHSVMLPAMAGQAQPWSRLIA